MWSEYVWNTQSTVLAVCLILTGIWVLFLSIETTYFAESVVRCHGLGLLEGYSIVLALSCHVYLK